MKRLFSKRWHRLPVAIIAVVLLVFLVAGGVLAATGYNFFNASIKATVEEAVYPSYGWGDDLVPYMLPIGAVPPLVVADPVKWQAPASLEVPATFTITKNDDVDASEFLPGEMLVIPISFRDRSDAPMTIGATVSGDGLDLAWAWETNTTGPDYRATETSVWTDFSTEDFTAVLAAHGGNFGSAQIGAQVLFIKITAPTDAPTGDYTITVTFTRS
jgi:hypothetical protein